MSLRLVIFAGVSLYALQFYLLGANTAAVTNVVSAIWQLFSVASPRLTPKWRNAAWGTVCAIYLASGYLTWDGPRALLPVAACIWTASVLMFLGQRKLRFALLASDSMWITNGVLVGSYGAMTFSTLSILINSSTLYRRRRERAVGLTAI